MGPDGGPNGRADGDARQGPHGGRTGCPTGARRGPDGGQTGPDRVADGRIIYF
jgi:hypothetical protein